MALLPPKPKQNFWDKVRDTFDANTEADYYRRAQAQLKANPTVTPVRQTYAQQQTERGIGRISNNVGARTINAGKSLWEGFKEAPEYVGKGLSYGSKQQQATDQSIISLQNQRTQELAKARMRLKDPTLTPSQRANYSKFVSTFGEDQDKINTITDAGTQERIAGTDPIRGAGYVASMGFDVATAGIGGGAGATLKTAGKQGLKQFAKQAVIEGAKSGAVGAGSGALMAVGQKGKDVTWQDVGQSAAIGGAIGGALPLVSYGAGRIVSKAKPRVSQATTSISESLDPAAQARRELVALQKGYDLESRPVAKRQLNREIAKKTQEIRDLSKGQQGAWAPGAIIEDLKKVVKKQPAPTPVVEKVTKPVVNKAVSNLDSNTAIRQMAGIIGEDVGQSNTGLGLVNKAISAATGGEYTNIRGLNLFRKAADTAGERITDVSERAITGKGSKAANVSRSVFAGSGLADETKQIGRIKQGILANTNDLITRTKKQLMTTVDSIDGATEALDRVMRDNKYIKRVYGDGAKKLSPNSLSPELRAVHDKLIAINKLVNDINYKTGVIDKKQWMGGRKGSHIARIFNIPKDEKTMIRETLGSMFESSPGIKRKDISKMTDQVIDLLEKDPVHAILIRQELALRNLAVSESLEAFAERGFIQRVKPNDNFIQAVGRKYGKYDGWFIERNVAEELGNTRIFDNQLAQAFSDLTLKYRASSVGVADSLIKSFKTAGTPGTILGNVMSNIVAFTPGAGTNPIYQAFDMIDAARKMSKGLTNADVFEARQLGVIGGDTAKQMLGDKTVTTALMHPSKNLFKRVHAKMGQFYGAIDDAAKLGLWTRLKKQGLDPQTAALEVAKFTQDYNNVGRVITLIADTPVMGKPFARFAPELVRIMKNNVTRSPHTVVASLALLAGIANEASKASKESDADREARETSVGETQIPGTKWINQLVGGPDRDISLNIAAGNSAVNIARSVGLNFPIEPGGNANTALVESLLPVEVPVRRNELGELVFDPTKVVTSMTVRPLVEQALDQNFMGGRITDPANKQYDTQGNVMKYTELSARDQLRNRGAALFTSLAPAGSEINAIASSIQGKPSVTGKERSLQESLLRGAGIKVTSNTPEARKKRTDIKEFFDVDDQARQNFLRQNKDLEQLYYDIYPKTKDRETGRKISDMISPEKWSKIQSDTSGRMFDFIKNESIRKSEEDKDVPLDPIYRLPTKDQERIVIELRSRPTGDDIEAEEILRATQSWYPEFEKAEREYNQKNSEYFKKLNLPDTANARAKAYAEVPLAEQPPLVKQYYELKAKDPVAAKDMFKTTGLSDAFDAYTADRLRYINAKRKIEGFPPISSTTFDNVTFGYEEDESKVFNELKYGKGYGGYGGGGGGSRPSSDSKFVSAKDVPTVKGKINIKTVKAGAKKRAIAKPKVTIRKSRV